MWMSRKTTSMADGSSGPASTAPPMRRRASVAPVAPSALLTRGSAAQEVEEFLQGGLFVVDGEYAQHEAGV
ncbi:hypothetical protein SBADM41S_04124 [Streptomyces badius]